uniref:Uncharacterized protein n=1 Tax=Anopheles maculatus TaxID=74869 RepID=A0A182SE89_9DIPT
MNAEAHSQAQEADQVLRDIALENLQLRRLTSALLVDSEFLRLCDTFDEAKRTFERASDKEFDRFSIDSDTEEDIISLLELKIKILQHSRKGCLQRIVKYNNARKKETPERQEEGFKHRLETLFCVLLDTMESEQSVRTLHSKLQDEIRRSLNDIQVNEEELASLRQKLFTSADSLSAQRTIAIEQREKQGLNLQEHLRTIDLLELDRQEIEGRVTRLIEEREEIQKQLDERRRLLHDGMREIVRLEHLIEQIEREISERTVKFQQQAQRLEQRRLDILNDASLSLEERSRLLAECDTELLTLRESHTSNINLLEARCDELKRQSKSLANDVETFRDEVAQKHRDQLAELERQKLLATTPSQIALIEAQIQQQQAEFNENLTMLSRAQTRPEYFFDEHGRYFFNEAGERIYKRDSYASEYRLGPDGERVKISSALSLRTDENGVYFIDKFGQKIYQQQHFTDASGEYYLDANGTRVYIGTATKPMLSASSSEFPSPFGRSQPHPPTSGTKSSIEDGECLQQSESMQELRGRIANDVAYIEETVGVVLRKGLAVLSRTRPEDPIGYLADYLALFQKNAMETKRRQQLLERLRLEESGCRTDSRI